MLHASRAFAAPLNIRRARSALFGKIDAKTCPDGSESAADHARDALLWVRPGIDLINARVVIHGGAWMSPPSRPRLRCLPRGPVGLHHDGTRACFASRWLCCRAIDAGGCDESNDDERTHGTSCSYRQRTDETILNAISLVACCRARNLPVSSRTPYRSVLANEPPGHSTRTADARQSRR